MLFYNQLHWGHITQNGRILTSFVHNYNIRHEISSEFSLDFYQENVLQILMTVFSNNPFIFVLLQL